MLNNVVHGAARPADASTSARGHDAPALGSAASPRWAGIATKDDVVIALVLTAVAITGLIEHTGALDALSCSLAFVGTLALIWRRTAPVLVLVICVLSFCAYHGLGYPHPGLPFALLVAVYTVATIAAPGLAAVASGLAMTAAVGSELVRQSWSLRDFDDFLVAYLLAIGAACALGYGVQLIRARTQLLRQQAQRLAMEHAAHEEQILLGQRREIARDLHDVISHQVSVITALAAGAGRRFDVEPERARSALQSIESAGREALTEMRRLLRVLPPDTTETARPLGPSCTDLPALARQTTDAGVPVHLAVHGVPRLLPAGVELCAYRIVQEALTNVLKHAGASRADVDVTYGPAMLELEIRDDGRGMPESPGTGHGVRGMRERAALANGRLDIGRSDTGGVRVHACFPADG